MGAASWSSCHPESRNLVIFFSNDLLDLVNLIFIPRKVNCIYYSQKKIGKHRNTHIKYVHFFCIIDHCWFFIGVLWIKKSSFESHDFHDDFAASFLPIWQVDALYGQTWSITGILRVSHIIAKNHKYKYCKVSQVKLHFIAIEIAKTFVRNNARRNFTCWPVTFTRVVVWKK